MFENTVLGKISGSKKNESICGLFNDAVSSSVYIVSSDMMTNELWIGKEVEGSGRGLI
jgi:hypothetical protein